MIKTSFFQNLKHYNVHDGLPENYVPSGHPLEPISHFIKAMPENYKSVFYKSQTSNVLPCLSVYKFLQTQEPNIKTLNTYLKLCL
jgi:hypothetical protein